MTDARGDPQQHGDFPALGNFHGGEREVVGFLGVGRLQHRHGGGDGVTAVVLLVLARRHARVIRRNHDEGANDAGVRHAEERIGGNVEADVLHGDERTRAAVGHADADFQRDFFIRRPLGLAANVRQVFEDFRRRRAGVAAAQLHATVQRGQRDGAVAAQ